MSAQEIDAYLKELDEPKRSTLEQLRATILEVVPAAEQDLSYGLPAFRVRGTVVAGFAAFKNHYRSQRPDSSCQLGGGPGSGVNPGALRPSRPRVR